MSRLPLKWFAGTAVACAGFAAVWAEIVLDDEVDIEVQAPPSIVVPDPTRGVNATPDEPIEPPVITNPPPRNRFLIGAQQEEANQPNYKLAPLPVAPAPTSESLTLANQETFRGRMIEVVGDTVRWSHPYGLDPLLFRLNLVRQVDLLPPPPAADAGAKPPAEMARVILTNGDELVGRIKGISSDTVTLETRHLGVLNVRRTHVQSILHSVPGARLIYHGPRRRGEWASHGRGAAEAVPLDAGGLQVSNRGGGMAFLDAGLPDRVRLDVDCLWARNSNITVHFFISGSQVDDGRVDNAQPGPIVGYQVHFWSSMLRLQRTSLDRRFGVGIGRYENVDLSELERNGGGRITIFASRPDGVVSVWLQDRLIKEWKNLDPMDKPGTGIGFNGNLTVSRVSVREWDGRSVESMAATPEQDLVLLANYDRVTGRLQSSDGMTAAFASEAGEMKFPLDRVQEIVFEARSRETPRLCATDTAALLDDGSRITLAMERLDDTGMTGTGDAVGRLTIPRSALQQIFPQRYE